MIGVLRPQRSTILSRRGSGRPSVNGSIGTMNPSGGTGRSGSTSNVLIRTSISLGREALAVARPPDRLLAPGIEGSRRASATYSLLRAVPRRSRGIADRRFEFELRFAGEEAYCSTFAFDVGRVRRAQLRGRPTPESGDVLGQVQSAKAPDSLQVVEHATSSTRLVSRVRRLTAWPLASDGPDDTRESSRSASLAFDPAWTHASTEARSATAARTASRSRAEVIGFDANVAPAAITRSMSKASAL